MMNIVERVAGNVNIYDLSGRINNVEAAELEVVLLAAIEGGHVNLILNMADVAYISSAGLRVLAEILTTAQESDGTLVLTSLASKVRRVFQIIGFDNFFKIFDDVTAALASFNGEVAAA